jgi:hypothetical protein
MVQRLLLCATIAIWFEFPVYSTEPEVIRTEPDQRNSVEEFNSIAEKPPAARPRGFARNGKFRGAAFRPGAFRDGTFPRGSFEGDEDGRELRGFPRRRQPLVYESDSGFAFIDGQLVSPPYRIERRDGNFYLNDIPLEEDAAPKTADAEDIPRLDAESLYLQFSSDRFVIKFPGRPVVWLSEKADEMLLSIILNEQSKRPAEIPALLELLPPAEDREQWSQWLLQVEVSGSEAERMRHRLDFLTETKAKATRLLTAEAVMDNYSYPLTLIGMIVVVLAVGYLLAFNPSMAQLLPEEMRAAQLSKSVRYSVILIVVMSGLDLAWTILSSSVGLMNELNPVGSSLLSDPMSLVKFKIAATLLAAGLFIGLRKFRSAQLASWWMCIVCTLVSARWLVFNSLYLG